MIIIFSFLYWRLKFEVFHRLVRVKNKQLQKGLFKYYFLKITTVHVPEGTLWRQWRNEARQQHYYNDKKQISRKTQVGSSSAAEKLCNVSHYYETFIHTKSHHFSCHVTEHKHYLYCTSYYHWTFFLLATRIFTKITKLYNFLLCNFISDAKIMS